MRSLKFIAIFFSALFLIACSGGGDDGGGDKTPTVPTISVSNASVDEGDSGTTNLTFTITLSDAAGSDVTVTYATSNGTATEGNDYTAANGTATITAGNTSTTVSVSVIGDPDPETDETFTLTLSNASGATLGTSTATGTITNDDGPPLGGPYMMYGTSSGTLTAIDISDPTITYQVASGLSGNPSIGMEYSQMIITGDVDVGAGTLDNFRPDIFVYFDADRFWRIDLKVNSTLTPTQISAVNSGYVCDMDVIDDVITPANSYIVFEWGADQTACETNGGQAYAIQVGDDSSVAPTSIPGGPDWGSVRVKTMETSTTPGQVTGFLVRKGYPDYTVTRYDINFRNPAVLLEGSSEAFDMNPGGRSPNGVSFYRVDGVLYSYTHDLVATAVTTMRSITSGSSFDYLQDNDLVCNMTHCFFVEVNGSGVQSLYMVAINGDGSTSLGTAFTNDDILGLSLTSGRLYINTTPKIGSGESLYAVSVSGGTPISVDSIGAGYFTGMIGAGEHLYYNLIDESAGTTISATVFKDDNTVAVSPVTDAAWVGFVFSSAQYDTPFEPSEFILAEEVTTPAGLKFTTYNASAATADTVVGTIDGSFFLQSPFAAAGTMAYGIGLTIFGMTTFGTESNYQSDVFMGDKTIAGSLQPVTNTAAVNEIPMF